MANTIHSGCKRKTAFAWAKYYDEMGKQADMAIVVIETAKQFPSHLAQEFMEMAGELKKKFECPVCLDTTTKDTIKISFCGHIYCKTCYDTIVKGSNPVCAVCRAKLS